jgi:hypothetical protein
MDKNILISTGIHNRSWILNLYLEHIYNLLYNKSLLSLYFIINNCNDSSLSILQNFKNLHGHKYNSFEIEIYNNSKIPQDERSTEIRNNFTYSWLSQIRNKIFSKCVELDCSYLASIDSDILVPKNFLNDLLVENKNIISSLIHNGYLFAGIDEAYKYPNILNYDNGAYKHIVNYYVKNPDKSPQDKLIPCTATGAACIYSKDICKKYKFIEHSQGEDIGLAEQYRKDDIIAYCKPYVYSQHIMSPTLLEKYFNGELNNTIKI